MALSASLASGATPPPPPRITPIISGEYAGDADGNRINDALESATGELSIASSDPVDVELIFSAPITQRQIDEFQRLGGVITYVYEVVSYGWNGCISRQNISLLPSAMGPTLVQVETVQQVQYYMDTATQVGRVRPVWKAGFAGLANGVRGDSNTTIGFLGGGVDAMHADLRGRNVYWMDLTVDDEPTPVDYDGHDTLVAAIAVGTGTAGGADNRELRFTYTYANASYPAWGHMTDPVSLPAGQVTMKSTAWWTGSTCVLDQMRWMRGTEGDDTTSVGSYIRNSAPATLTNTFQASGTDVYCTLLADVDTRKPVENVTIVTSLKPYPGIGDGFNKFSGVAPGCNWAAVKIFGRNASGTSSSLMTKGLDELVKQSVEKNIKVVNVSMGYHVLGIPSESTSIRDKVNTMVNNGIVVVVAAGNGANDGFELYRKMADPARAAMAITVGASNDENAVTEYSTYGFFMPRTNVGEDFKPDLVAPGGSFLYTAIMSADSGSSDGIGVDKEPNDYANAVGTSYAAPFVSGCAALVINAMESQGIKWNFNSSEQPRYVKMLLCATASETNAKREGDQFNPVLSRAAGGPEGFPPGKDQHEGYGLINTDAAVEAVRLTYTAGTTESITLGGNTAAKRVWARTIQLKAACDVELALENPTGADFDLYLYSATPSNTGAPILLASSTVAGKGKAESLQYMPTADAAALLVIKCVSGSGAATLRSTQAGPPTAMDLQVSCGLNATTTITFKATDDGRPNPPGAIRYTILSLPAQGRLERTDGTAITSVPTTLPASADKVVYRPTTDWVGQDSFTFRADDGGTAPFGGVSNTATVQIAVVREVTIELSIRDSADDACISLAGGTGQDLAERRLYVGAHATGLRFHNLGLPKGITITRATLKISCVSDYWGAAPVDGILRGEAADNPGAFGAATRLISQLPTTKASTAWKWTASQPWTKNTWYESPDLSAIVQEIINRPNWSSDNALVIIYTVGNVTQSSPESDRAFWSYDADPASAAKLTITYQP